jgi:hypothetical protein
MARFHKFTGDKNMNEQQTIEALERRITTADIENGKLTKKLAENEQAVELAKRSTDELFRLRDVEKQNIILKKENEALTKKLAHNTDVWKLVGQLMQLVDYKEVK